MFPQGLLERAAGRRRPERPRDLDGDRPVPRPPRGAAKRDADVLEHVAEVESARGGAAAGPARRGRAAGGRPRSGRGDRSPRRRSRSPARARSGVRLAPEGQLELGLEEGERRAQLVARVGDEAPLAREAVLDPGEHLVERLPQPRDLVARRAAPGAARRSDDAEISSRAPPHRLDRPQRRAGEDVAAERRRAASASGPPTRNAVRRLSSVSARFSRGCADDEHALPSVALRAGTASIRAGSSSPARTARFDEDRARRRARVELARREERRSAERRRRVDDASARVDDAARTTLPARSACRACPARSRRRHTSAERSCARARSSWSSERARSSPTCS